MNTGADEAETLNLDWDRKYVSEKLLFYSVLFPVERAKVINYLSKKPRFTYTNTGMVDTIIETHYNEGIIGNYTGLPAFICTNICYTGVFELAKRVKLTVTDPANAEGLEAQTEKSFYKGLFHGVVLRTVAIILSQPFFVITVRMIGQSVSNEIKYDSMSNAFGTILLKEGIFSLFSGLVPRILAELVSYVTVSFAKRYVFIDEEVDSYIDAGLVCFSHCAFHSLSVVSARMAVTNSGLSVGSPPNMPHYKNMFDCYIQIPWPWFSRENSDSKESDKKS